MNDWVRIAIAVVGAVAVTLWVREVSKSMAGGVTLDDLARYLPAMVCATVSFLGVCLVLSRHGPSQ